MLDSTFGGEAVEKATLFAKYSNIFKAIGRE
jgi:hypothetical protein